MPFLQQSKEVIVNGGTLIDVNGLHQNINVVASDKKKGEGIELLLRFCIPEVIHDLSACGHLGCHPGTQKEYICNITSWSRGEWKSKEKRAFLMTGPAGAGKSAIARTCAHKMKASGHLGASFFFYQPNGWNDPMKFIPTIVYQLTTQYPAFRNHIDAIILDDRLMLENLKAMDIQFLELLVKPLQKLTDMVKDTVIIVDGLDECATVEAQIQIIELVTTSILPQTTPFLWAFFSRPEPPITSAFSPNTVTKISWRLPLTLSGNANSDIKAYLRGSFETICAKYSIPPKVVWPTEEAIHRLVSQSAGLFIYPATAMRYIGKGTSGLEERLHSVLKLNPMSTENPFLALDQLYILIMEQIPDGILLDTMTLLLLYLYQDTMRTRYAIPPVSIHDCYSALGLFSASFYASISNLYSVLKVTKFQNGALKGLKFYHKSFPDFLFDKTRSQQYFLWSPSAVRRYVKKLVWHMTGVAVIDSVDKDSIHAFTIQLFFTTVEQFDGKLGEDVLRQVLQLNWCAWNVLNCFEYRLDIRKFIQKILTAWRRRIIRPSCQGLSGISLQILANMNPEKYVANAYIIGEGDKKASMM